MGGAVILRSGEARPENKSVASVVGQFERRIPSAARQIAEK